MKKNAVLPTKIARGRKIQKRQFEPEEIFIEYSINITDSDDEEEAIRVATHKAIAYLDNEEKRLRGKDTTDNQVISKEVVYSLEVTDIGRKLGDYRIKTSNDPQYVNLVHIWYKRNDTTELYLGFLNKLTGEFKLKQENIEEINSLGIEVGKHFKIKKTDT